MISRTSIAAAVATTAAVAGVATGVLLHNAQGTPVGAGKPTTTSITTNTTSTTSTRSPAPTHGSPSTAASTAASTTAGAPTTRATAPASSTTVAATTVTNPVATVHMEDLLTADELLAAGWSDVQRSSANQGHNQYAMSGCATNVPGGDPERPAFTAEFSTQAGALFANETVVAFQSELDAQQATDFTLSGWLNQCLTTHDAQVLTPTTKVAVGAGATGAYWTLYLPSKDGSSAHVETLGVVVNGNRAAYFTTSQLGKSSSATNRMPALLRTMNARFSG